MSKIILHQINDVQIGLRGTDGYVNATAMASAHKARTGQRKDVADWLRLKRTDETLQHLNSVTGIPVTELYQVFQGAHHEQQGTWIHPKLAVRFGMWLSDEFGLAVENWVEEWRSHPAEKPVLPGNYVEALKALVKAEEEKALQQAQIEILEADNERQAKAIDELWNYSSIIRVAKFNNCDEKAFKWSVLKAASRVVEQEVKKVPCPRFGTKNLYHHDAWRFVYPQYKLPETTTLRLYP